MLSINYQTLSKLVAECGKALSKTLSDPNVQTTIVTAVGASVVTGVIVDQIDKKDIKKAKEELAIKEALYKDALAKHDAMMKELTEEANLSKERQEYLIELNKKMVRQIQICKEEMDEQG